MYEAITRVEGAIHNPADPRHFMRLKPVASRVRILRDGVVLAESDRALRLIEVGRDLYDPALYLPREDVRAPLVRTAKRTRCPLKGECSYFDLAGPGAAVPEIAWSYEETYDFAAAIRGRIAFYGSKVTVEESPAA
jgi:uncharacterized protein (DUF427 family)